MLLGGNSPSNRAGAPIGRSRNWVTPQAKHALSATGIASVRGKGIQETREWLTLYRKSGAPRR
jgi:hypothetical protein